MADENPVKRKEREPVLVVFGIILLVACLLAIGIHINDHVINDDSAKVTSSSTVVLNYTGSLYNYYDQGGAMFQTTVDNIDSNTTYHKLASYSKGTADYSYSMSSGSFLAGFSNALLGHKAGDTIRVKIPASEAYVAPETYGSYTLTGMTCKQTITTTGLEKVGILGWTYTFTLDDVTGNYYVTYNMKNDDVCTVSNDYATITTTKFTYSAGVMSYDMSVVAKKVDGSVYSKETTGEAVDYTGVQMFDILDKDGKVTTVIGAENIDADGNVSGSLLTKATSEISNMDLYFVITIKSIS